MKKDKETVKYALKYSQIKALDFHHTMECVGVMQV